MPLRMSGWTNLNGRSGSRMPADSRICAASAASSTSSPASCDASRRVLCSSRASACASWPAGSGSRRNLMLIDRPAVRAPIRSTCRHASAVGSMLPSLSASSSTRTRKGVPPVARRQASTNDGSGALPRSEVTSSAIAAPVKGGSCIRSAAGSVASAASSSASDPGSHGRVARTRATCNSSSRVRRKER